MTVTCCPREAKSVAMLHRGITCPGASAREAIKPNLGILILHLFVPVMDTTRQNLKYGIRSCERWKTV
ncbi:hypothetical protein E2542_SST18481 [Spatholobus suberectus]|nr:hypothetical protein E2542_SST18481 [Spatholobus suberectus]